MLLPLLGLVLLPVEPELLPSLPLVPGVLLVELSVEVCDDFLWCLLWCFFVVVVFSVVVVDWS